MLNLTKDQETILGFHAIYAGSHARAPTVSEIAGHLGLSIEEVCESLRPLEDMRLIRRENHPGGELSYVGNISISVKRHDWLPATAKPLPQDRVVLELLLRQVDHVVDSSERSHSRTLAGIDAWRYGLEGKKEVALKAMEELTVLDIVHAADERKSWDEMFEYLDMDAFRKALLQLEFAVYVLKHRTPAAFEVESAEGLDAFLEKRMEGVLTAADGIVAVYRRLRTEIVKRLSVLGAADNPVVQMTLPQMAEFIWGNDYLRRPKKGKGSRDNRNRLLRKWIEVGRLSANKTTRGAYAVSLEVLKAFRTNAPTLGQDDDSEGRRAAQDV